MQCSFAKQAVSRLSPPRSISPQILVKCFGNITKCWGIISLDGQALSSEGNTGLQTGAIIIKGGIGVY